ncbi:hypothetical protein COOONC_04913 [Cooperia oncophora]
MHAVQTHVIPTTPTTIPTTHVNCNPAEDSVSCYCTNNNVSRLAQLQNTFPLPIQEGLVSVQGMNSVPTISTRTHVNCNPAEDSVSCYCTNNNVSRLAQLQNTFPLPIQEGLVSVQGMNSVPTISTRVVSVQTAITFDHALQEITQEFQNFQCRILPQQLLGCYNCVKGSIATLFCESDYFYSSTRLRVYETCRAQCGTYITIFELQGTLNYVNGFKPLWNYIHSWTRNTSTDASLNIEFAFPDISHFLDTCKQFFIYSLTTLLILISALMMSNNIFCSQNYKQKKATLTSIPQLLSYIPPFRIIFLLLHIIRRIFSITITLIRIPFRILCKHILH